MVSSIDPHDQDFEHKDWRARNYEPKYFGKSSKSISDPVTSKCLINEYLKEQKKELDLRMKKEGSYQF